MFLKQWIAPRRELHPNVTNHKNQRPSASKKQPARLVMTPPCLLIGRPTIRLLAIFYKQKLYCQLARACESCLKSGVFTPSRNTPGQSFKSGQGLVDLAHLTRPLLRALDGHWAQAQGCDVRAPASSYQWAAYLDASGGGCRL